MVGTFSPIPSLTQTYTNNAYGFSLLSRAPVLQRPNICFRRGVLLELFLGFLR